VDDLSLSGFTDPDSDEVLQWQRVERETAALCEPLAQLIGHKHIAWALGVSGGQLTRELSPAYENRLSLSTGLYILRRSQNEKLARVLICDGAGYRLPEPQKKKATVEEELRALKAAVAELGSAAPGVLADAARRLRAGR
jgi:hypothetical protein